ncbi:MAG TPA: excinuclease ABC subunit UvrC [Kosmotogaceae bacterium]|nr:MAG: UvrABC system protein C [Thermotogales bacterium 46_20]HAA85961.1 excinuclease ABC subunit UvrC [Kosmotogaceae bacterium]
MKEKLREKANLFPRSPGVYIFRDDSGQYIYVGKANDIRKRVQSYFRESTWKRNEKARRIIEKATEVDFIAVTTEREAILLEANLIFENKPLMNVLLKDSKTYPYIYVSADSFPYIAVTRTRDKEGTYYGPYTTAGLIRRLLELLLRTFKIRSCTKELDRIKRVCFLNHLGMCSAPCIGRVSQKEYLEHLAQLSRFLDGNITEIRQMLENRMFQLSDLKQYERAKEIRDILSSMDRIYSFQAVDNSESRSKDVVAISSGLAALLEVRGGMLLGKLIYDFPQGTAADFVAQFYYAKKHRRPSQLIVTGLSARHLKALKQDFEYLGEPMSDEDRRLMKIAYENINNELKVRLASSSALKQCQKILGLSKLPKRIEGVDISHTQGMMTTASVVVYENGSPKKDEYRRYSIRQITEPNDFESLSNVVSRRYSKHPFPDLLLIDGGEPQLRAVKKSLSEIGIEAEDLIGIAKEREEIVFPDNRNRLRLTPDHPVQRLLTAVRDESHRFAVNYHRFLRERRISRSSIDKVPGVGPKTKRNLIRAFGSVAGIRRASKEELIKIVRNRRVVEEILKWSRETVG